MARKNANDVIYELIEIGDKICLFIDERIDRSSIPEGLFSYDVRHDDGGDMCTIEGNVAVNYYGTLMSRTELLPDGVDHVKIEDNEYGYVGETQSLKEFISQIPTIVLCVNNQRKIQLYQDVIDGVTTVKVIESNGEVEKTYEISPGDMTMLLNYYQVQKEKGKEVL